MDKSVLRFETEIRIIQSSIKQLNPQFSLCDILVCYHGDNRNMTSIAKDVIEKNLYSIYGVPIIGEWVYKLDGTDEKTWGSHGGRIIIDDNGIHFEQTTRPFGFVTKEAADSASWVTITEKDGHTKREYLKLSECILWTERYEEAKTILDQNYGQSMEIEILDGHYRNDHYYEIEKFVFSALCILGSEHPPCFESACIGRHYAEDSFKQEYALMLNTYQANMQSKKEEENKMDFEKVKHFLSTFTIGTGEETIDRYVLVGQPTETSFTVVDREDNYRVYEVGYATEEENDGIVADWDNKVEKAFMVTDADTENAVLFHDIVEFEKTVECYVNAKMDAVVKEITEQFEAELKDKDAEYKTLEGQYTEAANKVAEYVAKEEAIKKAEHEENIKGIVETFSKKIGRHPEFLVYKARLNPENVTEEQVRADLTLMVGKTMMGKSSYSYQPDEAGVVKAPDTAESRYGNLLAKYK